MLHVRNVRFARRVAQCVLIGLLMGCATPRATAVQDAGPAQGASQPLVFGDPGQFAYTVPFFPGATYDPEIPTADAILGLPVGTRPAHHAEMLRCWRAWAEKSPRVKVETTGRTHEGRELLACVITSPRNLAGLETIRRRLGKLADPRLLKPGEEDELIRTTPAVAWMGYSIHGDEMSGVDGGLALAYHLIASTDAGVTALLDQIVVVIDPMLNPDGRERFLAMLESTASAVPNLDDDSLHRGRWPYGRGNHYLFDMNRDWGSGIAPETRARWKAVLSFHPQLFVDAHEMGGLDTFLFYPQEKPLNPSFPATQAKWHGVFGGEIAQAFDRYGWSYYTREWADGWAPFYSDAWASLNGAIGILYEQARFAGQSLRKAAGEVATYREAAHHQAVSSLANLQTLAAQREAVLRDYLANRRESVDPSRPENRRLFVCVPGRASDRETDFVDTLLQQGVEVSRTTAPIAAREIEDALGNKAATRELPAGCYVISPAQPQSALVHTYLDLDPRYDKAALLEERKELERKGNSKIYDTTAWNLAQAFDLEALWCEADGVSAERVQAVARPQGSVEAPGQGAPAYGWVVSGREDASVGFAARAMELGLKLQLADKEFTARGARFPRGSLLLRRHENPPNVEDLVGQAARSSGVSVFAVSTARSPDEGPDLGGQHFHLLARPRVALVSNSPVGPDGFGHVWHQLDRELALPVTLVDAQALGSYDLRRYNVLVLPPAGGLGSVLAGMKEDLEAWVRSGGTLIAMGGSAGAVANKQLGISSVRLRQDVLDELDDYLFAARREASADEIHIDEAKLWGDAGETPPPDAEKPATPEKPAGAQAGDSKSDEKRAKDVREDEWKRRFSPQGVFLRGRANPDEWITIGCGAELPIFFDGSLALFSRTPVHTAIRFAPAAKLRLAGLVWPEARERLAESAYLTVERKGRGQVILFAAQPNFRGSCKAGARLLSNAVVYGPGVGADQPLPW
jgi:zinc carboxypeptidase